MKLAIRFVLVDNYKKLIKEKLQLSMMHKNIVKISGKSNR